jgi:hypothetical protein
MMKKEDDFLVAAIFDKIIDVVADIAQFADISDDKRAARTAVQNAVIKAVRRGVRNLKSGKS